MLLHMLNRVPFRKAMGQTSTREHNPEYHFT
jgi:hypothetical protein